MQPRQGHASGLGQRDARRTETTQREARPRPATNPRRSQAAAPGAAPSGVTRERNRGPGGVDPGRQRVARVPQDRREYQRGRGQARESSGSMFLHCG